MGASRSKPCVSCSSPRVSEPRSPPIASVLAKETRDGARGLAGILTCIPPSEAAGPLRRRLRSALPEDGGAARRMKDVGNGGVPDTVLLNDDGQFQLASAGPESLLFSCQPLGAASDIVLGPSGSAHGVQPMSSFKLDGAKHKIFLSHSGAQKDFVEQLCVDLERMGYFFPFFDQEHYSLPKGEDFAPLIIEVAQLCHVAVIVLTEEFLCSKWPMIELAEFYAAQQGPRGVSGKLKLLPLFFKVSIEEVKDEGRWMPIWKEHVACDDRIDLSKWSATLKALCKSNGLGFGKVATKEVAYRKCVVESIFKLSPPNLLFGSFESMVGSSRMCEAMSRQFVEDTTVGARVLGIYGMAGLGKTMLAKALHDYFYGDFLGKVCYIDMCNGSRAQRQKWMLKMLCGFEKDVVDCLGDDVEKGLMQMKTFMKREHVFLVLDNITYNAHLLQEVQDYLTMGFHLESRIMITSSSKAILEDLLPNMKLYTPMPTLMVEEAGALFLKRAAPMKTISELTRYSRNKWHNTGGGHVGWLCRLHDESSTIIGRKVLDLRKSGMIHFYPLKSMDYEVAFDIKVPSLYLKFVEWYTTHHNVNGLKNACCVFQPGGMNLRGDSSTPIKCCSNLIRLRISPMTPRNAQFVASKRMQELNNLVVLQLFNCDNLTMLDLEGLDCLRDLELCSLSKLVTITLSGNSSKNKCGGIYDSLQHVRLFDLSSLVQMPDLRPCTSLHSIALEDCNEGINFEGVDCPCLKELYLSIVYPYHFERLVGFGCLQSLEELYISALSDVDEFRAIWNQKFSENDVGVEATLEGEGPCAKLLEELSLLFCRSNNMVCNSFETIMEGDD